MKLVPVSKVAEFINGRAFKPEEWEQEGLPIIRIQNLTGSTDITNYYSGEVEPKYLVKDGDILISWSASLGVYIWESGDAILNQHIFKVVIKEDVVDKMYFYYAAQNALIDMIAQVHGATMQHITRDPFLAIEIPLPPLPEQRRIAGLLSRADHLRRLRRFGDTLCASLLQSVFLEMFGDYLNKIENQFGDILEIPLANGFFEKNEKYGEGNPIVWVDNLYHTNIIDTTYLRRVQVSQKVLKKYEVLEGDLLFTRSSLVEEGVGQANIVQKINERTMFESHIIRARVDNKKINPFYALGLFRSQFGKSEIMKRAKTATMTTIGQDTLYEFPCPLPPLRLQEQFERVVKRVESLRSQQAESARQGEGLFQALLAQSFGNA